MKKPDIEVKCSMDPEDSLTFRHKPNPFDHPECVWVEGIFDGRKVYIKMTCERAAALGEALLRVYGSQEDGKINV